MSTQKLRVKIGVHEFEAEGPPDVVSEQFAAWKEMIGLAATTMPQTAQARVIGMEDGAATEPPPAAMAPPPALDSGTLPDIFTSDGKKGMVTLRVHPTGESRNADAVLLVLFGYKRLQNKDEVLVGHIKDALDLSGIRLDRVDRTIDGYVKSGYLLKAGMGKGGKYRLTMTGFNRATVLAKSLSEQMV
jgi:hypothetical protein